MSSPNVHYINEPPRRPLSATVNEVKEEFKRFAETRIAMLQAEMREKISTLKVSAPMLVIGGLLAATAFLVLTAALIGLLYVPFAGSPFAFFWACLIIGVVYAVVGFGALLFGYQNITKHGLTPERTIRVLKEDKIWFQNEARTQL
jgi:Putative Actinobacterial Holin-X, holin superfamily III